MKPTEIANLFKKSDEARLEYFVKSVRETQVVFSISDDESWALLVDDNDADETDIIPLFPNAQTAEAFRKAAGFEDMKAEQVPYDEFFEWLEELDEDGALLAILPNTSFECEVLEPLELKELLEDINDES